MLYSDITNTVTVGMGEVVYSVAEARVSLQHVRAMLNAAEEEGATHVVFLSGNYRGAQYLQPNHYYDWLEDEGRG